MAWTTPTGGKIGPDGGTTHTGRSVALGAVSVGDLIVVNIGRSASNYAGLAGDSVTDSLSNAYAPLAATYSTADGQGSSWWYTVASVAGSPTVTSAYGGVRSFDSLSVQAFHSSLGFPFLDQLAGTGPTTVNTTAATGVDDASFGPITPSADGCLIVATMNNYSGTTNVTAGTTPIAYTGDQLTAGSVAGAAAGIEHFAQTTAAAISATFGINTSAVRYGGGVASFLPSGGGTTPLPARFNPVPFVAPYRL